MKTKISRVLAICLLFLGSFLPAKSQDLKIVHPSQDQTFQTNQPILLSAELTKVNIEDPTRLHVWNELSGWRKLKLGNNPKSLYSPKVDVLAGGNQFLEILMHTQNLSVNWNQIQLRVQGTTDCSITLEPYIPENIQPNEWFICLIPIQDFGNTSTLTKVSFLEFPYSANAGSFDLSIASIRFTGGNQPFEWLGPTSYYNKQDGNGNAGQLFAEWVSGGHQGQVIPDINLYINNNLVYTAVGNPIVFNLEAYPAGQYDFSAISMLNNVSISSAGPVHFNISGDLNLPPVIQLIEPGSETLLAKGVRIPFHIEAMDPENNPCLIELKINGILHDYATGHDLISHFVPSESGLMHFEIKVTDDKGLASGLERQLLISEVTEKEGLSYFTEPIDNSLLQVNTPFQIVTENEAPSTEQLVFIEISNPNGGYRKLKIGNNPSSLYSPTINVIEGGNHTLELVMKDFNAQVKWDRLWVCPMEITTNPVVLVNHINQAEDMGDGWKKVLIPLQDFDSSIDFTKLSYLALPYSRDAGNFIIGISSIKFIGGSTPYVWFDENKTNIKISGAGGPGELTASIVNQSASGPQLLRQWITLNDSVIYTTGKLPVSMPFAVTLPGTHLLKLLAETEDNQMFMTDQVSLTVGNAEPSGNVWELILSFQNRPSNLTFVKTPLKYNKDFAYSFSFDDGLNDAYDNAFKLFAGGVAMDGINYPGLTYSDGCGNELFFTGGLALYSVNQSGYDLHLNTPGYVTWPQVSELYQKDWAILNHTWSHNAGAGTDYSFEVNQNMVHVALQTGIQMSHFVIPSGDLNYIPYAFAAGMKTVAAYKSNFSGFPNGLDVDGPINFDQLLLYRRLLYEDGYTDETIKEQIDLVAALSTNGNHLWFNDFTHRVALYQTGGSLLFPKFRAYLEYVANQYGISGSDRIWMASFQEVYEYLLTRDNSIISSRWEGNDLHLFVDLNSVPDDLRHYALTIDINADQSFTLQSPDEDLIFTYKSVPGGGMINLTENRSTSGNLKKKFDPFIDENKSSINKSSLQAMVYPNPVEETLYISPSNYIGGVIVWKFTDISGSVVLSGKHSVSEKELLVLNGLSTLSPGLYFLELADQKNSTRVKVIVQ